MNLCFNCGYANPEDARFCEDCGSALVVPPSLATAPAVIGAQDSGSPIKAQSRPSGKILEQPDASVTTSEDKKKDPAIGVDQSNVFQAPQTIEAAVSELRANGSKLAAGNKPFSLQLDSEIGIPASQNPGTKVRWVMIGVGIAVVLSVFGLALALSWSYGRSENVNSNSNANSIITDSPDHKSNSPREMLLIPGGQFEMGSDEGDQYSKPAHLVTVKPFFIDIYEVSCEEYKKCVDANKCSVPTTWSNGTYPAGAAHQPITGVSWDEANAYARWAEKRLPTEEEWEFAARGPKSLKYPWGNSWKPGCANADKEGEAGKGMVDVGSYNCDSPSGTKDMIGNAWEWTGTDWAGYPGSRLNTTKDGRKVIRGGSWDTGKEYATATLRAGYLGAGDKTGFRCAKDAP